MMTPQEELGWKYLVAHPTAAAVEVARNTGIDPCLAASLIDRIGTSRELPERELPDGEGGAANQEAPLRAQLLQRGIALTTGDRNRAYGTPNDNLTRCALLLTAYLRGKYGEAPDLTAEDLAHFMSLVKIGRTMTPGYHEDNYLDAAVYQTIAAECRAAEAFQQWL